MLWLAEHLNGGRPSRRNRGPAVAPAGAEGGALGFSSSSHLMARSPWRADLCPDVVEASSGTADLAAEVARLLSQPWVLSRAPEWQLCPEPRAGDGAQGYPRRVKAENDGGLLVIK